MKKMSFVDRILAKLQGGDASKLARFQKKTEKYFTQQISMREDEIAELDDKINDLKDSLTESVENIEMESLNKTETLDAYIPHYVSTLLGVQKKISALVDQQDKLQEEIDDLKATQELVFAEVEG